MAENYSFGLPIQASTYAPGIDFSLNVIHIGMAIIFIAWAVFFTYVLIRYRQGANPKADPNVDKWKIRSFYAGCGYIDF